MSAVTSEASASLESLEDVARRELGETPEVKQTALDDLRKLISGEPSLCCPTDDAFLVKFLRARKYDAHSAFTNVKKYFRVRTDHPELFKELTPSSILFDVVCRTNRLLTVSRHKDPLGRVVVLIKIGRRPKTSIRLFQDCLPLRLKGLYVINNPPIFDFFFAIAKTFLEAKLIQRVRIACMFFNYILSLLSYSRHLVFFPNSASKENTNLHERTLLRKLTVDT
nr:retinaldehyde-binding protein 1-like [Dermacentor andersoni]